MSVIAMYPEEFPASSFRADALLGRRAVISGGGSGIGFEIARQLGLHGAAVCIMGRREHVLRDSAEKLRADGVSQVTFCSGDVRDFGSCTAVIEHAVNTFGGIDILINCAAGNFLSPAEGLSPKGFRVVMEIDAFGCFHMSQAAFPHLRKAGTENGDATIINITAEFNRPPFFQLHAAAAKMAINSMTKSHALEWADYGIRVNAIAPGPIANTAGMGKLAGMGGGDTSWKDAGFDPKLPRGLQCGLTWDIGQACVYYSSTAGGYISGDIMTVDGGHHLREGIKRQPDGHLAINRELISNISRSRERSQRKKPVGVGGAKSKL